MKVKAIVSVVDGIQLKDPNAQIELNFDDQSFIVIEKGFEGLKSVVAATYKIPLYNLIETLMTTEKEFMEKGKSVIGRGVVGGVLFGPAGLILGGISGIGSKRGSKKTHLYLISYVSIDGELRNLTFSMPAMMTGVTKKFDDKLKERLSEIYPSERVAQYRNQKPITDFQL